MKSLAFGIVLILLLGIGGFLYRNVMENTGGPLPVACTEEAKICPDGTSVGRTGPSCEFAPCPNTDFDASLVPVPGGYVENKSPNVDMAEGGDMTIVREFTKSSLSPSVSHIIRVHHLGVSAEGVEADIVRSTRFQPSDMDAESIDQFTKVTIGGKLFYVVVIERFEGQVQSAYYMPTGNDLYLFTVIERDVTDWMDADLNVRELPEHSALEKLLTSLQSI